MSEVMRILQRGYEMMWREDRLEDALIGLDPGFEWVVPGHPEGDVRQGADATIAARPVPLEDARQFGVLGVDHTRRVVRFDEKPASPTPLPDDPQRALVSMGNYIFSRQPLVDALVADARRFTDHDFGR